MTELSLREVRRFVVGGEPYIGDGNEVVLASDYDAALEAQQRRIGELEALWDRWLAIYAEEHDETCTPDTCNMAALVADVRAIRAALASKETDRG